MAITASTTGTSNATTLAASPTATFDSIAASLGLGIGGGAALAGANEQTDAGEHPAGAIYTPALVGAVQQWGALTAAPVSMLGVDAENANYKYTVATQSFALEFPDSGGGILNLDAHTFTPVTFEGTDAPFNDVYVVNDADQLLAILPSGPGLGEVDLTETLTSNPAETDSRGNSVAASNVLMDQLGYETIATTSTGIFGLPPGGAELPFYAVNGGVTTTAYEPPQTSGSDTGGYGLGDIVVFNSASSVPDSAWTIGVDAAGDAVMTGSVAAGYIGTATLTQGEAIQTASGSFIDTPDIQQVQLYHTVYTLTVIPNSGIDSSNESITGIVAEGTGTSDVTIANGYWHINGLNDQITLGFSGNVEFYFAQPHLAYALAWDPSTANLTVTGGTTGATVFSLGSGDSTGQITFSDGYKVALGQNSQTNAADPVLYGGEGPETNGFVLDGGNQTVFAAGNDGSVSLDGGSTDATQYAITESQAAGQPPGIVIDGTSAGYDGVDTLYGVNELSLGSATSGDTYSLDVLGSSVTGTTFVDTIIVDAGHDTLTFSSIGSDGNDWHINGPDDTAILAQPFYGATSSTDITMPDTFADYTIGYDAAGDVTLTGGTTGTTILVLDGGGAEVNFSDGTTLGVGGLTGLVELSGGGYVEVTAGALVTLNPNGLNDLQIDDGGAVALSGSVSGTPTIDFAGGNGLVVISDVAGFGSGVGSGTYVGPLIDEFEAGDRIDLTGLSFIAGAMVASYTASTGLLQVFDGRETATLFFGQGDTDVADPFHLAADATGGTLLTNDAVACFARGTRILTVRGEIPVETLTVGDLVVTLLDHATVLKPVRWLGHRRLVPSRHADPSAANPVRIAAGALADGVPLRDLLVSPGHRFALDGVLVAAIDLVNDASITQEAVDAVEYWHVELDRHDVLLAEGAAAESYHDIGNRDGFAGGVMRLVPSLDQRGPAPPCLPYGQPGATAVQRLVARAEAMGWRRSTDPAPWLEVDGATVQPRQSGDLYRFALPAGAASIRLRSRTTRPSGVVPDSTDTRRLGLSVRGITLDGVRQVRTLPLADARLAVGWHAPEDGDGAAWRWTDGDAALPTAFCAGGGMLEVAINPGLACWVRDAADRRRTA